MVRPLVSALCWAWLALFASSWVASPLAAEDWPGWRGPARTGISSETGLLKSWPEGGPQLAWKTRGVGEGYSTPSVVGERIYLMGNRDSQEWVICLDAAAEGKEVWATATGDVRNGGGGYPGPRCTPAVEGGKVYALGLNGDLVCLDATTGREAWRKDLVRDFGGQVPSWGYSESPLVDGPNVLCTPGGNQAGIVALAKSNGRTTWSVPLNGPPAYASLVKTQAARVDVYVQFSSKAVVGVSSRGQPLWAYERPSNGTANISTPIVDGDLVFAASGYGTGGGQVRLTRAGRGMDATETFFTQDMKNHHGGMILKDGFLYGSNDPGILTCINWKSGETVWTSREPGKCSLICIDGMFLTRSEGGPVCLVEASNKECKVLGRFEQPDRSGNPAWPHPVVAHGKLYLRDQDLLLCYQVGK